MGDQQAVLLTDLGGVLFEFDHQHRLEVLGACLGLAPGKTDLLFCHRLAANKPDRVAYHQVTGLLAVPPVRISFADDSTDNVQAARRCG